MLCTLLVLVSWLGVLLYMLGVGVMLGVGPCGFGIWDCPKSRIPGVMGYVFLIPQGTGHGAAVYNSFDLEAAA